MLSSDLAHACGTAITADEGQDVDFRAAKKVRQKIWSG